MFKKFHNHIFTKFGKAFNQVNINSKNFIPGSSNNEQNFDDKINPFIFEKTNILSSNLKSVDENQEKILISNFHPFMKFFMFINRKAIRESNELIKNKLKNRVSVCTYNANQPMEDFHNAIQLKNVDGFLLSVLDGHGGVEMAKYANNKLHHLFDRYIKDYMDDNSMPLIEKIKIVIQKIFNKIEDDLFKTALEYWNSGIGKLAFVGTCVLTVIICNNNIFVANLGDSKAKLFRKSEKGYNSIKISKTYNANKISERVRLRQTHKDHDLFVTNDGKNFYIKGKLIPTKTLGDFYLKKKEFCIPVNIEDKYMSKVITNFTEPYIDSNAEVENFELTKEDEYLIIGSDGLWDLVKSDEICSIINESNNKEYITRKIFELAIDNASKISGIDKIKLLGMSPGYIKRKILDDITLMVVDLKNQVI